MFPKPVPGQVIRYAYLWQSEYQRGQEEGLKERPCAIIITVGSEKGPAIVTALPITHTPASPSTASLAIEIPHRVKRYLGLDDARSWVILTEANRFSWPGPDLCPAQRDNPASVVYGELPGDLLIKVRDGFLNAFEKYRAAIVPRSE